MITTFLALALAAAPSPVPRPRAVVWLPRIDEAFPRIEALSRVLSFDRATAMRDAGINTFDLDLLEGAGIKRKGAGWIWLPSPVDPPVLELELAKVDAFDAALTRLVAAGRGVHALDKTGAYTGTKEDPLWVIRREGSSVFIQLGRSRDGDAGKLNAIASARMGVKPREIPKSLGKSERAPDAVFVVRADQGFERIEGGAWLEPQHVELHAEVYLDFTMGLLFGDIGLGPKKSRTLVKNVDPAAELTATLAPSIWATSLESEGLSVELGKLFSGQVHALLTSNGSAAIIWGLSENANAKSVESIKTALAKRYDYATITVDEKAGVLVATVKGEGGIEMSPSKTGGEERAQAELRATPKAALDAIEKLARAKPGPKISRSRITALRSMYGDTIERFSKVDAKVAFGSGRISIDSKLSHTASK